MGHKNTEQHSVLVTEDLTLNFGALRAISGLNLRIGSRVHSIIGPNGAGKTTLFNLLSGFLTPTKGKIFYKGNEITGLPPHKISQMGIGRSFQITSIFPDLSVYENIRVAAQSRLKARHNFLIPFESLKGVDKTTEKVLENVGLGKWGDSLAKNLSYGLKRCLDIGISLATDPKLILLDEPTSGMGQEDADRILELIRLISQDIPVVLIEHNIDVVLNISDRITVLYQGMLLAEGTPSEIQDNDKVQEAYLGGY